MNNVEGADIFADDFMRQEQDLQESNFPSEIQKFFEGTSIFVTGGTGFLGKILLEKLLRVCWRLKKIYLLIRPKKGKSIEQRFEELFEGPLFDRLKKEQPNFQDKLVIVMGDLSEEGTFLSEQDQQMLTQNVEIIFHSAATVRFDEKLRRAVNINVKATKFLLDLAREMKNLKAFLYVSTAYSNCPRKEIGEKFYPPPFDYKKITNLLEIFDDNLIDRLLPILLDKWPNTYAFTKCIAESTVNEFGKGLPIGVFRPSIIISTYKEPITGWINNYYGPQGVVFGAGLGLLRSLHCDPKVIADMVPVDLVINALLAFTWDIGQTKGDNPNFERLSWKDPDATNNENIEKSETTDDIPIINYTSSTRNPIDWGTFMDYNYNASKDVYSPLQLWHSSVTLNKHYYMDLLYRCVCHFLPALVADFIAIVIKKKPQLWNAYKKIHKFLGVIAYFCTNNWKFEDENVTKLWDKMSPRDRLIFNFNIEDLDWEQFLSWYMKGIRVYLANDALTSLPEGRKRAMRFKIVHYSLVTFLYSLLFYFLWWIFSPLFK